MTPLTPLLGTELPLIQAPMAGVQASALALAAGQAGALGSLPCAMLTPEAMRQELQALQAGGRPYNVNFFCHTPPAPDAAPPQDPATFPAHARAFGYPPADDALLLRAFRLRFRPQATGPADTTDATLAAALATRYPVDATPPQA